MDPTTSSLEVVLTYLPTYWQKTHLKTPLIYLQHCHVDEYSGSVFGALDFRYNWSCLVRVSRVCAPTQLRCHRLPGLAGYFARSLVFDKDD